MRITIGQSCEDFFDFGYHCVPFPLCDLETYTIITDGSGISGFDPRSGDQPDCNQGNFMRSLGSFSKEVYASSSILIQLDKKRSHS